MRALYKPNTLQASQFALVPFQRAEINLNNIDRSEAEFFPQYAGTSLYVERADFPVVLSTVNPSISVEQSFIARDGLEIVAPFKGLFLSHPRLDVGAQKLALSLILGNNGSIYHNQLATPVCRNSVNTRAITQTAISNQLGIFVPPGARALRSLSLSFAATTVTSVQLSQRSSLGVDLNTPIVSQLIGGASVFYNGALNSLLPIRAIIDAGIAYVQMDTLYPLRTAAVELFLNIAGTGMVGVASNISASWE